MKRFLRWLFRIKPKPAHNLEVAQQALIEACKGLDKSKVPFTWIAVWSVLSTTLDAYHHGYILRANWDDSTTDPEKKLAPIVTIERPNDDPV